MSPVNIIYFLCLLVNLKIQVSAEEHIDHTAEQLNRHSKKTSIQPKHAGGSRESQLVAPTPKDCSDLLEMGQRYSGKYFIYPNHTKIRVYCDMTTDGGGWTVIQRRGNFTNQTDFYRNWEDYKKGFGNVKTDFWLGNDLIHSITNQDEYALRIDATLFDEEGTQVYVHYNAFRIGDEESNYALNVNDFKAEAGMVDVLGPYNNTMFSTKDRQNDGNSPLDQCAQQFQGAWWYEGENCALVNLNGPYTNGTGTSRSNWWINLDDFKGLRHTEMKIRPARELLY